MEYRNLHALRVGTIIRNLESKATFYIDMVLTGRDGPEYSLRDFEDNHYGPAFWTWLCDPKYVILSTPNDSFPFPLENHFGGDTYMKLKRG